MFFAHRLNAWLLLFLEEVWFQFSDVDYLDKEIEGGEKEKDKEKKMINLMSERQKSNFIFKWKETNQLLNTWKFLTEKINGRMC